MQLRPRDQDLIVMGEIMWYSLGTCHAMQCYMRKTRVSPKAEGGRGLWERAFIVVSVGNNRLRVGV